MISDDSNINRPFFLRNWGFQYEVSNTNPLYEFHVFLNQNHFVTYPQFYAGSLVMSNYSLKKYEWKLKMNQIYRSVISFPRSKAYNIHYITHSLLKVLQDHPNFLFLQISLWIHQKTPLLPRLNLPRF